jgi:hypothetical protein
VSPTTDTHAAPRRSLLGLAAWGGMALVGTVAGVFGAASAAQADPQGSPCCDLAKKTVCGGSYCNRRCPSGYTKRYWWCNSSSGLLVGCGECIKGSTSCHGNEDGSGSIACSWWWYVYNCEN